MDAAHEGALSEAAIGARDHVLASDAIGVTDETLRDQLGMLDDIGRVADDAGQD